MTLEDIDSVRYGDPFKIRLKIENRSEGKRTLTALVKAASIYKPNSTLIWELKNNGEYPENLREITVKELAKHNSVNDTWVSIAGYVINASTNPISKWFKIHRGRDITSRALMHFHDIPLDKNDDR